MARRMASRSRRRSSTANLPEDPRPRAQDELWLIGGAHRRPQPETRRVEDNARTFSRAPRDVLLSRASVLRLDVRAEETVRWTPEAEERMTHVPGQGDRPHRGSFAWCSRRGIRWSRAVIDEAMDRFRPKSASAATKALAEAVALERAKSAPCRCRACGRHGHGGTLRHRLWRHGFRGDLAREMIEKIAAVEGGLQEETTYDAQARWSEDARKGLWTTKNAYQRAASGARRKRAHDEADAISARLCAAGDRGKTGRRRYHALSANAANVRAAGRSGGNSTRARPSSLRATSGRTR